MIFREANLINVYNDGVKTQYVPAKIDFEVIMAAFEDMIEGARNMPAFGVSLNDETQKAMQNGLWIEFEFPQTSSFNGMSFSKLLAEVVEGYKGFNIARYNKDGGYSGRCFYLDLNGDMSRFYKVLKSL